MLAIFPKGLIYVAILPMAASFYVPDPQNADLTIAREVLRLLRRHHR
jgi:hypothetical protein